jgi:hypothetical protein
MESKSTILDPHGVAVQSSVTYSVKDYLIKVGVDLMSCCASGATKYYQIGEAWWWYSSSQDLCIYSTITKDLYHTETGLDAPNVSKDTAWASLSEAQQNYINWCGAKLGAFTHALKLGVLSAHATAKITQLIFSPSIAMPAVTETVHRVNTSSQWNSPEYDFIQIEDYDWIIAGGASTAYLGDSDTNGLTWDYITELGYSMAVTQYFSGFQLLPPDPPTTPSHWGAGDGSSEEADKYKIIGQLRHAIERKNATGFIWARPQVFRDGVLFEGDPVLEPYKIVITTQPTAPATNGGALAVQPILEVQDINGNKITDSTASIVAAAGQGTWTLGGTKTKSAVAGVGTFTNLTATVVTGDEPAEGEGVLQFRAYRNYETTEFFNKIYYYITGVFKKTYTARTRVSPNVVKYKFSNVDNEQHLVRELKVHELVINLKSRLRRITKI